MSRDSRQSVFNLSQVVSEALNGIANTPHVSCSIIEQVDIVGSAAPDTSGSMRM